MHRPVIVRVFALAAVALWLTTSGTAMAATEETKRQTINDGLVWLIGQQVVAGDESYWPYSNDGTLAATAAVAMAFIEEGFLPGENVVIGIPPDTTSYGDVVGRAVTYILNRALYDPRFGVEMAGYWRYAEDYNGDGIAGNDGGNDQAIYFEPGASTRRLYTTGICAPVVFALGEALGIDAVVEYGSSAVQGRTYGDVMQDIIDWFCFAQVEPTQGSYRGGWRYDANYPSSDNSTAQWGSLPLLYADAWGLPTPDYVYNELELWVNYIQNPNGGSGYTTPWNYVNVSKTGGLLLQLAAIGADFGDSRVVVAHNFINSRWNTGPSGTWYGNLNHAYAMWAVYKGLEVHAQMDTLWSADGLELMRYGFDIPAAPGGIEIGWNDDLRYSAVGDWYSHYCDYLVGIQNGDGSWSGYQYWYGPLATAWYINILRASPGGHRMADPDIQITSAVEGDCVWYRTPVTHTIRYWFGTPGYPDPQVPPAEDVMITVTLSPHLEFVSATGDYWWDGARTVRWSPGVVPDGDQAYETIVTEGAGSVESGMELVTFADISASNVPEELWDYDESRVMTCLIEDIDVSIDVKPGSCPNPVNIVKRGVVPVAVLGTMDFDVTQIDPSTVRLEGVPALRSEFEDVATPYEGELCGCHVDGPDGYMDLTLKFDAQAVVAALGEVIDREEREVMLAGALWDGTLITGLDCILIIAPSSVPEPPDGQMTQGGVEVAWDAVPGPLFVSYAVYRGTTADFLPQTEESYVALTTEPMYVDIVGNDDTTWYYRIGVFDEPVEIQTTAGTASFPAFSGYSESGTVGIATGVTGAGRPGVLSLLPASPNPFRSHATVTFTLPTAARVQLAMYDVAGRLVKQLVDDSRPAGTHVTPLRGEALPSGTYFIRLEVGEDVLTRRVTLTR